MTDAGPIASPPGHALLGHLPDWLTRPLDLLDAGAALGDTFALRLGRRAVVGWRPDWNRAVLGDLATFRSGGSFSALVPYLAGGIILTDAPAHRPRRRALNPGFFPRAEAEARLRDRLAAALAGHRPTGRFDTRDWAADAVVDALNAAFFGGGCPRPVLTRFLAPLDRPMPAPLVPRPRRFRAMRAALERLVAARRADGGDDLLAHLVAVADDPVTEARIALAAAYDTTAHTLALAAWRLAAHPAWRTPDGIEPVVRETLRLCPPGFVGSRRAARDVVVGGTAIRRGDLVLYSPWLTHRAPALWPDAAAFDPARWLPGGPPPPALAYLPFGSGERICLGAQLAGAILDAALGLLLGGTLEAVAGDPTPKAGLTLAARGPLVVARR